MSSIGEIIKQKTNFSKVENIKGSSYKLPSNNNVKKNLDSSTSASKLYNNNSRSNSSIPSKRGTPVLLKSNNGNIKFNSGGIKNSLIRSQTPNVKRSDGNSVQNKTKPINNKLNTSINKININNNKSSNTLNKSSDNVKSNSIPPKNKYDINFNKQKISSSTNFNNTPIKKDQKSLKLNSSIASLNTTKISSKESPSINGSKTNLFANSKNNSLNTSLNHSLNKSKLATSLSKNSENKDNKNNFIGINSLLNNKYSKKTPQSNITGKKIANTTMKPMSGKPQKLEFEENIKESSERVNKFVNTDQPVKVSNSNVNIKKNLDTSPFPHFKWKKVNQDNSNIVDNKIEKKDNVKDEFSQSKYVISKKQVLNELIANNKVINNNTNIKPIQQSQPQLNNANPETERKVEVKPIFNIKSNNSEIKEEIKKDTKNTNEKLNELNLEFNKASELKNKPEKVDEKEKIILAKESKNEAKEISLNLMNSDINNKDLKKVVVEIKDTSTYKVEKEKIEKTIKPKKIRSIKEFTRTGFNGSEIKKNNQDIAIIYPNFNKQNGHYFFSVCDGHGLYGHDVSRYIKNNLPSNLESDLSEKNLDVFKSDKKLVHQSIQNIFNLTNTNLNQSEVDSEYSGSTCTSMIFSPEKIITSNIGDSRIVMGRFESGSKFFI